MLAAIVVALLLSAPSPAPSPAPGREECTTLRQNVRTALAGLMKNDEIIESGRKAYQKMSADRTGNTRDLAIDRLYVENAVTALVRNLAIVDDQLADPKRFPPEATAGTASTTTMKAQLSAIAAEQKKALDLFSGALETGNFNAMQNSNDGPTVAHSRSSLSAPGAVQNPSTAMDTLGSTPDDNIADEVSQQQARLQSLESKASMTVMSAAAACNGMAPNPAQAPRS